MTNKFYIGGSAFLEQLRQDMALANDHVFVQSMTFEMDSAGQALVEAFQNSPAHDQRLMVDAYSQCVINDCMMVGILKKTKSEALQDEYRRTQSFMTTFDKKLKKKFINPLGFLGLKYPCRNHKKLIVIDQKITYIGGINFSEHNFEWQDFMLRLDNPLIASEMRNDFLSTWEGKNRSEYKMFENTKIYFLDGIKSFSFIQEIIQKIRSARHTIYVLSPYLSPPFFKPLKEAAKRGVSITIITPSQNNKPLFTKLLTGAFRNTTITLVYSPGMHHFKGMLIDNETLLTGSFNFDFVSCCFEQEVLLETNDLTTVKNFNADILSKVLKEGLGSPKITPLIYTSILAYYGINILSTFLIGTFQCLFFLKNVVCPTKQKE